jgi:ABC-2 type transport system permease protein
MRPLLAMVKANLKMSVRNRTALFWNLAFPALFIVIFGLVFGRGMSVQFAVGIAGPSSPFQARVVAALAGNQAFTVRHGEEAAELAALRGGERDVVILFASDPEPAGGGVPTVTLYYDAAEGPAEEVAVGAVQQVLLDVAGGPSPVEVMVRPVAAQSLSFIDFFVPGILAMSLMNAGVIGMSTSFVIYRERGILRRIKVTPFPLTSFVLARVISQVIIAVAQALILVGLARLLFGSQPRGNPLLILLVVVVGALAFLAIGFAVSGIARNAEIAASYANMITFPMLFLSGVFFSIESAPVWLQPVARLLPLAYMVDALRAPMMRGEGLAAIWRDLLALAITFGVALAIAVRFFRWEARPS